MITLIFADCECEYDDHVAIFFETLKNHIEDFGCLAKIDLTGIKITKEEFDDILNVCNEFVKNDNITKIVRNERQQEIENYLGLLLVCDDDIKLMEYCARHGLLDIIKYVHENKYTINSYFLCSKYKINSFTLQRAAFGGHLECLKYFHENGYHWDEETCTGAAAGGRLECLKYLREHGCKWDGHTCLNAALNGHLECLKYAYENKCPIFIAMCKKFSDENCKEYLNSLH